LDWVIELAKSVYGLKDAPLMWFIMIDSFLRAREMKPTAHDPCVYKLCKIHELVLLLSLHVDDTLSTGTQPELDAMRAALEKKFGSVKREVDVFRHFGVDIVRCKKTSNVYCSQADYLRQLSPNVIDRPRGSGRTLESALSADEVTLYRSLVSAIAWLGVTFPPALACASLCQGFLPLPTVAHVNLLNTCLCQFKEFYTPDFPSQSEQSVPDCHRRQ
jgi:hypothetical protein